MAIGSQQIAEDFEQLKELLELYPAITIIKTEGQPPDNYEIEYALKGFVKTEDNSVSIGQNHQVRISLPFGYPHFAPIAKPLTPIFHPDIDPAAIRLADQWQRNPSLPELVLHIGEMICGAIYNLQDPFNQEAADWYARNKQQLPLDSINIADIQDNDDGFDSLVDDTFASLGLESDTFLEPERKVQAQDVQEIRDLIAHNKIFAANKLLGDLPQTPLFPDRDEVQQNIGKILRKVDQLFKLAEQFENMAKLNEAMAVVQDILAIAVDAPGIDPLSTRIQQAFQISQSVAPTPAKQKSSSPAKNKAVIAPPPLLPKTSTVPMGWLSTFPVKLTVVVTCGLALSILAISLYFKDQSTLSQAQASLLKGQLLIDKRQFENGLESLESGRAALADLTLLRFRKPAIEKEINTLITSKELQEGLHGRVLYQGEYIPAADAAAQEELTGMTEKAQGLANQNKLSDALNLYRQALKYANDHGLVKQYGVLNEIIQSLELRQTLFVAERAEVNKNWDEAAAAYRKALDLSGSLNNLGSTNDITQRMTAATVRHELDQSKKAFNQSQWQETIRYLEQAQQAIKSTPNLVTEKERQDLQRLLVNARLYLTLSTAREAYQQKNWQVAIEEYQHALGLLTNEASTADGSTKESIDKIEKTLLLVQIAQLQEHAIIAENRSDLQDALRQSNEIQRIIKASPYQSDPSIKNVAQKIIGKIEKLQDLVLQSEKIAWLEEHFEEIFRTNYPTFKGSKLSQPKAKFVKKVGQKMIFQLSCLEQSQGSSSKLELQYQLDLTSGKWSTYDN